MKILITGSKGQLGNELQEIIKSGSAEIGAKLVQVSTDYVFNGNSDKPLTEYDLTAPNKIKEELGWYPETTFEIGIKKTIKWYLDN